MATLSGLSREQIIRLEAGACDPHWRTVVALASALRADPIGLFPLNSSEAAGGNRGFAKSAGAGDGYGED